MIEVTLRQSTISRNLACKALNGAMPRPSLGAKPTAVYGDDVNPPVYGTSTPYLRFSLQVTIIVDIGWLGDWDERSETSNLDVFAFVTGPV